MKLVGKFEQCAISRRIIWGGSQDIRNIADSAPTLFICAQNCQPTGGAVGGFALPARAHHYGVDHPIRPHFSIDDDVDLVTV
jgi:hypothetical protein